MAKKGSSGILIIGLAALIYLVARKTNSVKAINQYDLNEDGVVDEKDLELFKTVYGKTVDINNPLTVKADFNGDGFVNMSDFGLFIEHYQGRAQ